MFILTYDFFLFKHLKRFIYLYDIFNIEITRSRVKPHDFEFHMVDLQVNLYRHNGLNFFLFLHYFVLFEIARQFCVQNTVFYSFLVALALCEHYIYIYIYIILSQTPHKFYYKFISTIFLQDCTFRWNILQKIKFH